MSSNNSNIDAQFDPNKQIKIEPGELPSTVDNLIKVIKQEPGISNTARLPSFRVPRDLTLGGNVKLERPKKIYTPNLNAQRIKNREDQNLTNKNETAGNRNRVREKRKDDKSKQKGKGRGKATSSLVQSSGIFSEGFANTGIKRYSSSGGYRDRESSGSEREASATLERSKLSISDNLDKAVEAEKLRRLLRDDFIDDKLDLELENTPVALPLINQAKLFKSESDNKINIVKEDATSSISLQNGEACLQEEVKPIISKIKARDVNIPLTVPQILENKLNNFVLMQLPDCLPGLQTDNKQYDAKSKKMVEVSTKNETDTKLSKLCTLSNLKEGMLGKLQILRSGKTRLVLGDNNLLIDVGSNVSFRQDLIAAKISNDKQNGVLVNLGAINGTLIFSPDLESMLKNL